MIPLMRTSNFLASGVTCRLVLALCCFARPAAADDDWKGGELAFQRIGLADGITPEVITTVFRDRTGFLLSGSREGLYGKPLSERRQAGAVSCGPVIAPH